MNAASYYYRFRLARVEKRVGRVLLTLFTIALSFMFMFPFLWTVSSALKQALEVMAYPPTLIPKVPQWRNFRTAWNTITFGRFMLNTLIIAVLALIGEVISAMTVAYGFARFRFPGREALFVMCLSTMILPAQVTIIPLFVIFHKIHWLNSYKPLIVPSWFGGAFAIFLFRQFIMTLPLDLDEAALIDGAGRLAILTRIIFPNCIPVVLTVAILSFLGHWNDFLGPLIFLNSKEKFTISLGLYYFKSYGGDPGLPRDHLLMAGNLIATIPVVVLFFVAQRYFIRGIVMSGIKG